MAATELSHQSDCSFLGVDLHRKSFVKHHDQWGMLVEPVHALRPCVTTAEKVVTLAAPYQYIQKGLVCAVCRLQARECNNIFDGDRSSF